LYILVGIPDVSCIPTGIYNTVHAFSSDLIICKVSSIPTSIYNNVHALFFWPYHEKNKAYTLLYIPVGIHDTVHMIRSEE
jgi:hypothetical protein